MSHIFLRLHYSYSHGLTWKEKSNVSLIALVIPSLDFSLPLQLGQAFCLHTVLLKMRPLCISLAAGGFFFTLSEQSSWNSAFCLQRPYTEKKAQCSLFSCKAFHTVGNLKCKTPSNPTEQSIIFSNQITYTSHSTADVAKPTHEKSKPRTVLIFYKTFQHSLLIATASATRTSNYLQKRKFCTQLFVLKRMLCCAFTNCMSSREFCYKQKPVTTL